MSQSSSSSSSSPIWLYSYIKLQFFNRIRRFLRSKRTGKRSHPSSDRFQSLKTSKWVDNNSEVHDQIILMERKNILSEDHQTVGLQRAVKNLNFGSWKEKDMAAKDIQRLAKEDVKVRKLVAELGVIPVLVNMVSSEVVGRRRVAIMALIQLADGTYTNKALMVEAGLLSKLPKDIITTLDESTRHEFTELVLNLSSLANTSFSLASSQIIPFLINTIESHSSNETKQSCLGTLYNLSTVLDNAVPLVSKGVVQTLLKLSPTKALCEKALATLGNLVVTLMAKKAMEHDPMVPESLIEILTWEDKPKCQELSAYILMILAHQSSTQREKMNKSGIVNVLLEVALLGSPLAQTRALKLLQWFRDERQAKMGPHSGPQTERLITSNSSINQKEAQQGKKMMNSLVKQSLHKNLEIITKRANASGDLSKLKSLVISTSSKSLPY